MEYYEDDNEDPRTIPDIEEIVNNNYRFIHKQPAYDWIINIEVLIQHENDLQDTKVIQRSIILDGTVAVEYDDNPILNSMVYNADLPYGAIRE